MNQAAAPLKRLLVVYHSMTGATEQMVQALARGAGQEAAVSVLVRHAPDAVADDVLTADAYVFASPENLASMSGLLKDFFDRTYYAALDRINGRAYACVICAGSDGQGAARQIARIATGWRLRAIAEPLIVCTHAQSPQAILAAKQIAAPDLERAAELGAALAGGLAIGAF